MDSGDEWDKTETVGPSRSSTPTTKIGPTWEDVHAATQEEEMEKNQTPSWEDIVNTTPTEEGENWDAVDSQSTVEDQSDDVIIEDEVVIQAMMEEEELDHAVAGSRSHNGTKMTRAMWTKSTHQPPLEKYHLMSMSCVDKSDTSE